MSDLPSDIDELPEDVRSLLDSEKSDVAAPADARAMVLDRVFSTVGLAPAPVPTQPPPPVAPATAGAAATAGLSPMLGVVALGAALAVGSAVLGLRARSSGSVSAHRAPTVVSAPSTQAIAPITAPAVVAQTATTTTRIEPATPSPVVSSVVARPSSVSAPSPVVRRREVEDETPEALGEEQQLLGAAQRALTQRDANAALAAVRAHARRFSRGTLSEERDALEIRALLLAEREDEARSLAARFRRRYPDSVFIATIDARLGAP